MSNRILDRVQRRHARVGALAAMWRQLGARLRGRKDSEHEQLLVRGAFAFVILGSLEVVAIRHPDLPHPLVPCLWIAAFYLAGSIALLAHLLWQPQICPPRRVVGMLLDLITLPVGMIVGGSLVAPLYPMFLWITLGMGFRYGRSYLLGAAGMSLLGFALVVALNDYWRNQPALSAGLWLALLILPAYALSLLGKLTHALDRAEAANRAKSRFVATMSHELRTPLNAIIGMADLLRDSRLGLEQQEMVRTVRIAGQNLLEMIDDILDLARIEAGKVAVDAATIDLHELTAGVRALLHREATAKGVQLRVAIDPRLPPLVVGGARPLRQIMTNLAVNGIKFTDLGAVTTRLIAQDVTAEQVTLRLEVEDTGIGIPEEAHARVFEQFTQVDESATRRHGGSGLGLAIAHQLADLIGGRLTLESDEGRGSCFTLVAPFRRLPDPPRRLKGRVVVLGPASAAHALCARLAVWGAQCRVVADLAALHHELAQAAGPRAAIAIEAPHVRPIANPSALGAQLAEEPIALVRITADPYRDDAFLATLPHDSDDQSLFNVLRAALAVPEEPVLAGPLVLGSAAGRRVLVAEDNRINQRVIAKILERGGHAVTVVEDGEAALDALEREPFDLVLMDLNMPVMSGLEAVKMHRFATDRDERRPFVALSADVTDETRQACIDAGMAAFLAKPVDASALLTLVDRLAGGPEPAAGRADGGAVVVPHPRLTSALPPLDRSALDRLRQLDDESLFVASVIDDFVADAAQLVDELEDAAQTGDAAQFRERSHALRSSAAHIGATALLDLCLGWRGISAGHLRIQGPAHAARLRAEFERLRTALLAYREQLSAVNRAAPDTGSSIPRQQPRPD